MYKITAPTPYNGVGYGLRFTEGVAMTDSDSTAKTLEQKGYLVERMDQSEDGEGATSPPPAAQVPIMEGAPIPYKKEIEPPAVKDVSPPPPKADEPPATKNTPPPSPEGNIDRIPENPSATPLEKMDVEQLTEYAKSQNIDLGRATSQATILERIQKADTVLPDDAPTGTP